MSIDPGPYCSDDLSDWWVPVEAVPNRMKAAHVVRLCMDPDNVLSYEGLDREARLDREHEAHWDGEGEVPECVYVGPAWHFTADER